MSTHPVELLLYGSDEISASDKTAIYSKLLSVSSEDFIKEMVEDGLTEIQIEMEVNQEIEEAMQKSGNNTMLQGFIASIVNNFVPKIKEFVALFKEEEQREAQEASQEEGTSYIPDLSSVQLTNEEEINNFEALINAARDGYDENFVDGLELGSIFGSIRTREDFLTNFDQMLSDAPEGSNQKAFLLNIQKIGAANFFDALDTYADGSISEEEIAALSADGTTVSAEAFKKLYDKVIENAVNILNAAKQKLNIPNQPVQEPVIGINPPVQAPAEPRSTKGKSGGGGGGGYTGGDIVAEVNPADDLNTLRQQRKDFVTQSQQEIANLNSKLDEYVSGLNLDENLKSNYLDAKSAYEENQNSISEKDVEISGYDTQIFDVDAKITNLKAESGALETNTGDSEIDTRNQTRKTAIDREIQELETARRELDTKKQEALNLKTQFEAKTPELQENMQTAYEAMTAELDDATKGIIEQLKQDIENAKADFDQKLTDLDEKIAEKEKEVLESSETKGEQTGKLASNKFGNLITETALQYLGYNESDGSYKLFSTGNYGWCADFVSYVVKEVFKDTGVSLEDGHLGASPYKLRTRNGSHYTQTKGMGQSEKAQYAATSLKPGMVFISKGSGASGEHTGIVLEVYDDGTFLTVEGNHNNKVTKVKRSIYDSGMYGFVDLSYLYN